MQTRGHGFRHEITSLSFDGSVAVGFVNPGSSAALFRWSSAHEHLRYIYGLPPRSLRLNLDGSLLHGGEFDPAHWDTFRYANGQFSYPLRTPKWPSSGLLLQVISADGSFGYMTWPLLRWDTASNETFVLNQPPNTLFYDVSANGSTLVGLVAGAAGQGARWTHFGESAAFLLHPTLPTQPVAISGDGKRIIGYYMPANPSQWLPFIWEVASGLQDLREYLNARGASVPRAWEFHYSIPDYPRLGISHDGTVIAGSGRANATAGWQPWRATLPAPCYANCDSSTMAPVLNIADFSCFLHRFASGDLYANCDESSQPPYLNIADFACFLAKVAAGCP